jgi:hypothetical protein
MIHFLWGRADADITHFRDRRSLRPKGQGLFRLASFRSSQTLVANVHARKFRALMVGDQTFECDCGTHQS